MKLIPVQTPFIKKGDDIVHTFFQAVKDNELTIHDNDIIAFADKILAISEGRFRNYQNLQASQRAMALAEQYSLEPGFVELVLQEAEEIYGGVPRALLTLKNNILIANAGIDHKNAPKDSATLWPINPNAVASRLRRDIEKEVQKSVGVILVDSRVVPMRMGTLGVAIGIAGFEPVKDCRGMVDLYGKPLLITRINVADDLAGAAHFVMGETTERNSIVIIRGSNIEITDRYDPEEIIIPIEDCLYMKNLTRSTL